MTTEVKTNKGGGNGRYPAKRVAKALREHHGMIYVTARALGCHHSTIYSKIQKHKIVRDALEESRGHTKDVAEDVLFNAIKKGEPWAVKFYLETQAKDRGYVLRTEHTGAGGDAMKVSIDELGMLIARADKENGRVEDNGAEDNGKVLPVPKALPDEKAKDRW